MLKNLTILKPTERLIVLALRLIAPATADEIGQLAGISQRYHVQDAIRTLTAMGMVIASDTTPTTYALSQQ